MCAGDSGGHLPLLHTLRWTIKPIPAGFASPCLVQYTTSCVLCMYVCYRTDKLSVPSSTSIGCAHVCACVHVVHVPPVLPSV